MQQKIMKLTINKLKQIFICFMVAMFPLLNIVPTSVSAYTVHDVRKEECLWADYIGQFMIGRQITWTNQDGTWTYSIKKKGTNWVYKNNGNKPSIGHHKGEFKGSSGTYSTNTGAFAYRKQNCANYASYVLQEVHILKPGMRLYCSDHGVIKDQPSNSGAKAYMKKWGTFHRVKMAKGGWKHTRNGKTGNFVMGDVLFYRVHTDIFYQYSKTKKNGKPKVHFAQLFDAGKYMTGNHEHHEQYKPYHWYVRVNKKSLPPAKDGTPDLRFYYRLNGKSSKKHHGVPTGFRPKLSSKGYKIHTFNLKSGKPKD